MGGLAGFFGRVLYALNDVDNMDLTAQRSWKRLVAALVTILCVGSVFSIAWAQGWVPGLSGVAKADELTAFKNQVAGRQASLEKKQDGLALLIVKDAIRNALNDACLAGQRKNQQAFDSANHTIDDLADQYRQLTNRDWQRPDCRVVLIDPDGTSR